MNTNPAMLANIARNRFDHLPRLVYADWLDEQGDDDAARTAEFIRVGVALAGHPQRHRPSGECDCDRCRLVRRQTELHDAGASYWNTDVVRLTHLGFTEVYQPVENYTGGFVGHFRSVFQRDHVLTWFRKGVTRLAHAVGEAFRLMPVASASVQFHDRRRLINRPGRRTLLVEVRAYPLASASSQCVRVVGVISLVGDGGSSMPLVSCEYHANHPKRVPHLARVATHRLLCQRHGRGILRSASGRATA